MTIDNKQHFKQPALEIIKNRYSARTYRPEKLSDEIKDQLHEYAIGIKGPFSINVHLQVIESMDILKKNGGKIGTYGVIKGAQDYIAGIVENGDKDLEQLGYVLEKFILYATSIGLGTCWMGGTFKKSDFQKLVSLKENEKFPIVTPIGYPQKRRSVLESLIRLTAGSSHRKPWSELFFQENWNTSLDEKDEPKYANALEAVRLAPSASNKQPWRILKKDKMYHFYLESSRGYGNGLGFNIQRIDIGIAMCHFELVLQELGVKGRWAVKQTEFATGKENLTYTISWIETEVLSI